MNFIKSIIIIGSIMLFASCGGNSRKEVANNTPKTIVQKVDAAFEQLEAEITFYKTIATLDHHRMAAEVGVYTPPSIALIFSDAKVNTTLLKNDQLIGLDLPYKILCYTETDTSKVSIAYTSGDFIAKRHGLSNELMTDYNSQLNNIVGSLKNVSISKTNVDSVDIGFGIISIQSDFDFLTTVQRLMSIVSSQSDTKWFGEIDFQKGAKLLGEDLDPTILLFFGGPAPGGKAMMTTPKIGLDAFCQKLLVYEKTNGEVWIAYNDIIAFADLYYGTSTKPQKIINQRLKLTFSKAVRNEVFE